MLRVSRTLAERAFFVVCILAAGVSACSDITGVPTSNIQVRLTGAQVRLTAAPSDMIASAEVWISHVYLQGGGDDTADETGRVDLFNDPEAPLHFDLLTLQDGITADLTGLVEVEAELYQGLRLVVDRARVTLVEGLEFVDGTNTATLMVPSGSQAVKSRVVCKSERKLLDASVRLPWRPPWARGVRGPGNGARSRAQ